MSKTFKHFNPRKAAGPDSIPSRVPRACADQLAGVFTDIFNQSLSQSAVSTCFKRATIVPVPKKAKVTELNDCRPVALTPVIMYRPNRSTDDAIATTLHTALTHLDNGNTYVRMLLGNNTSATLILNTGALRGVCSVPSCTLCSPMTAWPSKTPTPSLSLLTTQKPDHRHQ